MAGTFTLGGQADGLLSGGIIYGPSSINGARAIGSDTEVLLEALPYILRFRSSTFVVR